jgi:hypothetical protein
MYREEWTDADMEAGKNTAQVVRVGSKFKKGRTEKCTMMMMTRREREKEKRPIGEQR